MSSKPKACIVGVGMITAIGGNAESTVASVEAGISRYKETSYLNKLLYPIVMALVPNEAIPELKPDLLSITSLTPRQIRMLKLVTPALEEALEKYILSAPIPLFLAGPEKSQNDKSPLTEKFLDHIKLQTNANIDRKNSRLILNGKAGGIEAVNMAFKYFDATGKDYALVGGVDTFCDLALLAALDNEDRVKVENSMDTFIPGEAASFILIMSERAAKNNKQQVYSYIHQPGLSIEPGHRYSTEPYQGDGLANAFRIAIENSDQKSIGYIYSSMNGESFSSKEYGVAITRNSKTFSENFIHIHPADCFGDIGASFGATLIGFSSLSETNRKSNEASLIYCSSEYESRAAIYISNI